MRKPLILLIKAYKLTLSPFLGRCCRFHPSCANYAMESIERHGALRGGWMTLGRIGRCHPWHEGGYDPVPPVPVVGGASRVGSARRDEWREDHV